MKQGDLVTVLTNAGEFIGRLDSDDEKGVTLSNPKMIVNTPEGKMGFARGVCLTGVENTKIVQFRSGGIVLVTPCNPDINKAYTEVVSGIVIEKSFS
tara:strand:+ start:375 stop:665 length:291 start_codon:yes stop_codon:yes gene_type:complete